MPITKILSYILSVCKIYVIPYIYNVINVVQAKIRKGNADVIFFTQSNSLLVQTTNDFEAIPNIYSTYLNN